jgi:hypothetical protein
MSLTLTVPAAVPSLCQSSTPLTPSVAEKYSVPLMLARLDGVDAALPGLMSLTRTVPAAVPSLFQSSRPLTPSSAEKKSVPPTFMKILGPEPVLPGPDVLHENGASGRAVALPQLAAIGGVARRQENGVIDTVKVSNELPLPTLMSLTMNVPAAVPSLLQSS